MDKEELKDLLEKHIYIEKESPNYNNLINTVVVILMFLFTIGGAYISKVVSNTNTQRSIKEIQKEIKDISDIILQVNKNKNNIEILSLNINYSIKEIHKDLERLKKKDGL